MSQKYIKTVKSFFPNFPLLFHEFLRTKINPCKVMARSRYYAIDQIRQTEHHRGCVDARMTSIPFCCLKIPVGNKANPMIFVMYEPHGRYSPGMDVQQVDHILLGCKRQTGATQLR